MFTSRSFLVLFLSSFGFFSFFTADAKAQSWDGCLKLGYTELNSPYPFPLAVAGVAATPIHCYTNPTYTSCEPENTTLTALGGYFYSIDFRFKICGDVSQSYGLYGSRWGVNVWLEGGRLNIYQPHDDFTTTIYVYDLKGYNYGDWNHLAIVVNTSLPQHIYYGAAVYLNGEEIGEYEIQDFNSVEQGALGYSFGNYYGTSVYGISGAIEFDEFRIQKGIDAYTNPATHRLFDSFTPPSAPYLPDSNTLVLYHFDRRPDQDTLPSDFGGKYLVLGTNTNIIQARGFTVNNQYADTVWVCRDDSLLVTAEGGDTATWIPSAGISQGPKANMAWIHSPAAPVSYRVQIKGATCTPIYDTLVVMPLNLPTVSVTHDTMACPGTPLVLTAGSPDSVLNWQWQPTTGLSDTASATTAYSGGQDAKLWVRGQDAQGCWSPYDTATVRMIKLQATGGATFCKSIPAALSASANVPMQFSWSPSQSLSCTPCANPFALPDSTTLYTVTGIDSNGCQLTDTARAILPTSAPWLTLPADTTVCPGRQLVLTAKSNLPKIRWSPASWVGDSASFFPTFRAPDSTVQLTAIAYTDSIADSACVAYDTLTIRTDSTLARYIAGQVLDSTGTQAMPGVHVEILTYNSVDSSWVVGNTAVADSSGFFRFDSLPPHTYYLRAVPDSVFYPTAIPTYAASSATQQQADSFPDFCGGFNTKLRVIQGVPATGADSISGVVALGIHKRASQSASGLVLLLADAQGHIAGRTLTDANGAFAFHGLKTGSYRLWADAPHIDNMKAPVITLTSAAPSATGLNVILHPTWLELQTVGLAEPATQAPILLYPNPASRELNLEVPPAGWAQPTAEILDLSGRQQLVAALSSGVNRLPLALSPGVYLVRIGDSQGKIQFHKLVVQ